MPTATDRRQHARVAVDLGCKIYRRGLQRYVPGRTRDVSAGGALLLLVTPRAVVPGERLDLGVAWSNSPVLLEDALMEAHVIRSTETGDGQHVVAVRFDNPSEHAIAA